MIEYGRRKSPGVARTIILIMLLALAVQPHFFERNFYLNEIVSLCGLMSLLYKSRSAMLKTKAVTALLLFIAWGCVHLVASLFTMESLYAYLRHSAIIYSSFCFFLATWLYEDVRYWFYRATVVFRRVIILFSLIPIPGLIYRLSVLYVYPLLGGGGSVTRRFLFVAVCILLLTLSHGGGSGLIALLVALYVYVITISPKIFWTIFFMTVSIIFGLYAYNYDAFVASESYGPFALYSSLPFLAEDPNSLIRTYFWHLSINRAFDSYGFGIGMGSQLFSEAQIPLFFEDDNANENLKYFLFPHNSFLGVFARFGIVGFFALAATLFFVLKKYSRVKVFSDVFSFSVLTMFAFTLSVSLMNVVIESPITAGVFWFIVGLAFCNGKELNIISRCRESVRFNR